MTRRKADEPSEAGMSAGRFSYGRLERIIHERARLGIMTSLAAHARGLLFGDLKELCALTDGNLSRHLSALQKARLVEIEKSFRSNRPQTVCRLTALGRKRFLHYVQELERVVRDATASEEASPGRVMDRLSPA